MYANSLWQAQYILGGVVCLFFFLSLRMCVQDRQSVLFEAGVATASAKLHMHPGVGLLDTIPRWRRLYVAWCSQCEQLVPEAHNISMKLYGISFHITTFFLTS